MVDGQNLLTMEAVSVCGSDDIDDDNAGIFNNRSINDNAASVFRNVSIPRGVWRDPRL